MSFLIVLGVLVACGACNFAKSCQKPAKPPMSREQSSRELDEMIGKSQAECRRILKKNKTRH